MAITNMAEGKLGLALATGALVYGVYQIQMPRTIDLRTMEPGNEDAQGTEKAATWTAAAAVAGISLVSKSPEVFVVGGLMTIVLAWTYRHADAVNPYTKKVTNVLTASGMAHKQEEQTEAATAAASGPSYDFVF